MEEEKEYEKVNIGISEERGEETLEMRSTDAREEKEEQTVSRITSSAESRGRMIAAALIGAVIVSGIAVLVAGVFPTNFPVVDSISEGFAGQ